ncbi:16S rRNA (uracil(1498)-N(3))-methyltransferase, partial [Mesorhizobium japonicum]|uniref:16S rRNA (uracil(1498)-N(3))-methyltransferase n=1 Tax=Mesorhizobium japonicum TaxID=2066070 RepID=UPI003B5A6853
MVATAPGELTIEVEAVRHEPEPEPRLWLAQALAKGDRDELAIQAATELGASGIIPFAAERSVSRWEGQKAQRGR